MMRAGNRRGVGYATVADAFPIGRMGGGGDERQCGARDDEYERGGFCGSKDHIYIHIIINLKRFQLAVAPF